MIDIHKENLMPITQVPEKIPSSRLGKRIHLRTLYRWQREGRLETVRIGGRWYTSEEALERFIEPYALAGKGIEHRADKALHERIRRMRTEANQVFGPKDRRNPGK